MFISVKVYICNLESWVSWDLLQLLYRVLQGLSSCFGLVYLTSATISLGASMLVTAL